ncbi:MAG: M14 family zinc carboxypeptidase [Solirubrobacteraceae bacterium]
MRRRLAVVVVCSAALAGPAVTLASGRSPDRQTVCAAGQTAACGGRVIAEPQESAGFITYPGFQSAMNTLAHTYPHRVHVVRVGHSAGGYPLYDVLVSDFADRRPLSHRLGLYFNGSIHGDERDGAEGFARVAEDLAEAKSPALVNELRHELIVFTFANPDGWVHGDVPDGLENPPGPADGGEGPGLYTFTRWNQASHDLNREWPVVGFQNETSFPLRDPEVRGYVTYNGNYLHRRLGIHFAYAFDVHGSSEPRTPPAKQLMLDILMGADQMDLTRTMLQTHLLQSYLRNLARTSSADPLHHAFATTGNQVYTPGLWDTTWDIYGYQVSGDYADWMANQNTGLGAVADTVELWVNGEPGQENTFVGYNPLVEESNVHSLRVLVSTAMDAAIRRRRATLELPGPIAYVVNRFALTKGRGPDVAPVGPRSARPPSAPYPASNNRFFSDLARESDASITALHASRIRSARQLRRFGAVVIAQDPHQDTPGALSAIRRYAAGGGTVILTDRALRDLATWHIVPRTAVGRSLVYAGYVTPTNKHDPLTKGARELSGQTYEPVPLGYELSNTFSSSTSVTTAPAWWVTSGAWRAAGGDSAGTTGSGRTSLGSVRIGRGQIRIIGSLLPNPTGKFTHPFGADSYDLTYWGYQLLENALRAPAVLHPAH